MKLVLGVLICVFLSGCGANRYLVEYEKCQPAGDKFGLCLESGVHKVK